MAKKTSKKVSTKQVNEEHSLLVMPIKVQKKIDQILQKIEKSEAGLMDLSKVALRVLNQAKSISETLKEKVVPKKALVKKTGTKRKSK